MENVQELTLNRLPAPTWNWLGMNACHLSNITANKTLTLSPELSGEGISHTKKEALSLWPDIESGMGKDVDNLTEAAESATECLESAKDTKDAQALLYLDYGDGNTANRLYLHAEENSTLKVTVVLKSPKDAQGLAALQIKAQAEKNAQIFLTTIQLLAEGFTCFNDFGGVCAEGADIQLLRLELGAGKLYAGAETALRGAKSNFESHVGYLAKKDHVMDMNYTARHHGKKTTSLMTASGVLSEGSKKLFRGTIDFPQGCPGSKGEEREEVLLLGDDLVNQTIPLILCAEEDVEGDHGATIGKLDDDMLFYLASRGIPAKEAEKIMARARLDAVCERIERADIRQEVALFLDEEEE